MTTDSEGVTGRRIGAWRVFFSAPGDRASLEVKLAELRATGEAGAALRIVPAGGTPVQRGEPIDPTTCVWTFKVLAHAGRETDLHSGS